MRVMVIPEDPTLDQYILGPVIQSAIEEAGLTGSVEILKDPHLKGASQALDPGMIRRIIGENRMMRLFILVVDRDCDRRNHEAKLKAICSEHPNLIGCLAVQEVEVWMLSLYLATIGKSIHEVRSECDPKETFA